MKKVIMVVFIFSILDTGFGQNLLRERIRKLKGKSTSVYLDQGIFYYGGKEKGPFVKTLRHFYDKSRKRERIVFDLSSDKMPKVYGLISRKDKKIYIDFFDTEIKGGVGSLGTSKFLQSVDFFPWSDGSISVEMNFKSKIYCDVFFLQSPGRLVIDVKGAPKL